MKRWTILLIVFMALVVLLASLPGVTSAFAQRHRHNSPRSDTEKRFSEWSEPVNLGAKVNSAFNDWFPAISPNGLSLYISSNRPGGFGAATFGSRNAPVSTTLG